MTNPYDLLGVPFGAEAATIEAAYATRKAEYSVPDSAPADVRALAATRLAELAAAREALLAKAEPAPSGLGRREWAWMGAGVLLAVAVIALIVLFADEKELPGGLVALERPAPDITLETLTGDQVNLAQPGEGKILLVNFWATWCEPCKYETPDLVAAQAEFGDQLAIIGVNLTDQDVRSEIESFVRRYQVNYPIALDPEAEAQKRFNVYGIPHSFFIDSSGQIRYTRINVVTREDIQRVLQELQSGASTVQ